MWVFLFFFSSRRRHTRFDCDWSSDVCSSDLGNSTSGKYISLLHYNVTKVRYIQYTAFSGFVNLKFSPHENTQGLKDLGCSRCRRPAVNIFRNSPAGGGSGFAPTRRPSPPG